VPSLSGTFFIVRMGKNGPGCQQQHKEGRDPALSAKTQQTFASPGLRFPPSEVSNDGAHSRGLCGLAKTTIFITTSVSCCLLNTVTPK
jgi:hypothetical protein